MSKGFLAYLSYVRDNSVTTPSLDSIFMVWMLIDFFPITCLDSQLSMIYTFILMLNVECKHFYFICPIDLALLKDHKVSLWDLLGKGLIESSVSPWDYPILFVKEKDNTNIFLLIIDTQIRQISRIIIQCLLIMTYLISFRV